MTGAAALLAGVLAVAGCSSTSDNSPSSEPSANTPSQTASTDGSEATSESSEEPTTPPSSDDVVQIAWASQPPTLDPIAVTTTSTNFIAYNVFEGLLGLDADLNVHPVLAESWDQEGYQTFTFKLRTDVKFHNGDTMTAADVVASLEHWLTNSTTGKANFEGATVEATDDQTVVLRTVQPTFTAAYQIAQPTQQAVIMPASSIAQATDSGIPTEALFGTGPYMIGEVVQDSKIVLDRFEDYKSPSGDPSGVTGAKSPVASQLVFNIVPDQTTRLNGLVSGQYDFATEISPDNASQLDSDPSLAKNTLNSGILAMLFNKQDGVFSDVKARQAVQAGLDIEAIMMATYGSTDYFDLNGALAPRGQEAWFTEVGLDNYNQKDEAKAKQLLAESSYNGETVRFVTTRDYPYMYNSAVVIADQMTKMGLTVDLTVTDWAGVLDTIAKPDAWEATSVDFLLRPVPTALSFFNPTYFGGTDDPAILSAIDAINTAPDEASASAGVDALQTAFFDYVPVIKFGEIRSITGQRTDSAGFVSFLGPVFYNAHHTTN